MSGGDPGLVQVNSPKSNLRTPHVLLREMFRDLVAARYLGWRLFCRDIAAMYRRSLFGFVWTIIPPLVAGIAFIFLRSKNVVNFGDTDIPYPVFALTGTVLWQVFVESLNAPLKTVLQARPVIVKVNFPREALILSAFLNAGFHASSKIVVLIGILFYFDIPFRVGMVSAPLAILILVVLGVALGLLMTPLGLMFSDVESGLLIVVQFWFFLTPVVYPPPTTYPYSLLATLNPVSPLLNGARDVLVEGVLKTQQGFLVASVMTVLGFVIAWFLFRLAMQMIIERIGQ